MSAVEKLSSQGGYWEERSADPDSGIPLFVKAAAEELPRFRGRMNVLPDGSRIGTAHELIADWERVLPGEAAYGKTLTERRLPLKSAA